MADRIQHLHGSPHSQLFLGRDHLQLLSLLSLLNITLAPQVRTIGTDEKYLLLMENI